MNEIVEIVMEIGTIIVFFTLVVSLLLSFVFMFDSFWFDNAIAKRIKRMLK